MKLRYANAFLITAILIHGIMLVNIAGHFSWQPGWLKTWLPQKTNAEKPSHWDSSHSGIGPFLNRIDQDHEALWKEKKKSLIKSSTLMAVPPRMTDNFGLDFLVRDSNNTDPGGDFFQLVRSGLDVRNGTSIYENYPDDMDPVLKRQMDHAVPFHPPNRYPPGFAFSIGFLLSYLKPWTAYQLWFIVHELTLLLCIFISRRMADGSKVRFRVAAAMWLAYLPWYLELYMGQTTFIIMTATLLLAAWLDDHVSAIHSGFWWTFSLITKPISLLFAPVLFRKRRFGMLVTGIGIAVASAAGYFVFRPADGKLFLTWMSGQEMVHSLGNYCFQALLYRFHMDEKMPQYIMAFFVVLGLLMTFRSKKINSGRLISMWVCIYFLAYTHVWEHHLVLFLPAVIIPWLFTGKKRYLIPWFLSAIPSTFFIFNGHWNWTREVVYLSGACLPVLILFFDTLFVKQIRALSGE